MSLQSLGNLVSERASIAPDSLAVVSGQVSLTYGEAAARVAALAGALRCAGVGRGDRVGVYVHKSVESYVGVHAILQAGAAYVPLDPTAPGEMLATVINDCDVRVLVSSDQLAVQLAALVSVCAGLRCIVDVGPETSTELVGVQTMSRAEVLGCEPFSGVRSIEDDLAYVMYTSGSTGKPKGIMHTHRSGLAYARYAADLYGVKAQDRLANSAPLHFDISTFDLFVGPLAGACTLMIPEPYLKMPASLAKLVEQQQASFWYSVPFLLVELLRRGALEQRDLSSLRWVLFGGEVMEAATIRGLGQHMPNAQFSNVYGPAEVNQCTYYNFSAMDATIQRDEPIPIGTAWSGAELRVVDEDHQSVEPGTDGELMVRSATMMDGYWNRADLNAAAIQFVDEPGGRQTRWLATGDLVRAQPDGLLQFLGRRDNQVKVRGNRVELESVESALAAIDSVEYAVAGLVDLDGQPALAAGICFAASAVAERAYEDPLTDLLSEIQRNVAAKVPAYAVPHRLFRLHDLPTTGTGKIDRKTIRRQLQALVSATKSGVSP
jgi:amino acid adenylation domain-containing protein